MQKVCIFAKTTYFWQKLLFIKSKLMPITAKKPTMNRISVLLHIYGDKKRLTTIEVHNEIMQLCGWTATKLTRVLNNSAQPVYAEKLLISKHIGVSIAELEQK